MINVVIEASNHVIKSIEITGHANYADYGNDIVCAAVSTASIMTVNALNILGYEKNIEVNVSDSGFLAIKVLDTSEIINKLLINLTNSLEELEKQYKKNIKIKR